MSWRQTDLRRAAATLAVIKDDLAEASAVNKEKKGFLFLQEEKSNKQDFIMMIIEKNENLLTLNSNKRRNILNERLWPIYIDPKP